MLLMTVGGVRPALSIGGVNVVEVMVGLEFFFLKTDNRPPKGAIGGDSNLGHVPPDDLVASLSFGFGITIIPDTVPTDGECVFGFLPIFSQNVFVFPFFFSLLEELRWELTVESLDLFEGFDRTPIACVECVESEYVEVLL